MATNNPNEPTRTNNEIENRPIQLRTARAGFPWMWVWVVLIIAAFWFAGWGFGGYGGWWWGGRHGGVVGSMRMSAHNGYGDGSAPTAGTNTPATYGAPANGAVGTNAAATHITGSGLEVLQSTNKKPYVGKTFQLANVPVVKQVNGHVFWVGRNESDRILVVTSQTPGGAAANSTNMANNSTSNSSNATGTNGNSNTGVPSGNLAQGNLVDVQGTVAKAPAESRAKQEWGLADKGARELQAQGVYVIASNVQPVQP